MPAEIRMPSLDELSDAPRPVYDRVDGNGQLLSRHRLKVSQDMSFEDHLTLNAVSRGFYRHQSNILDALLYDPPTPDFDDEDFQEVVSLWNENRDESTEADDSESSDRKKGGDLGLLLSALQDRYGYIGLPWLKAPSWMVNAFNERIPSREAHQSIRFYTAVALGSGGFKKGAARRILRQWRRQASQGQRRSAQVLKPKSKEELMFHAAASGIKVKFKPKES